MKDPKKPKVHELSKLRANLAKPKFVLYSNDLKSYYRGRSAVGPMFGGTKKEAHLFESHEEAALEIGWHWAMGGCEVRKAAQ